MNHDFVSPNAPAYLTGKCAVRKRNVAGGGHAVFARSVVEALQNANTPCTAATFAKTLPVD